MAHACSVLSSHVWGILHTCIWVPLCSKAVATSHPNLLNLGIGPDLFFHSHIHSFTNSFIKVNLKIKAKWDPGDHLNKQLNIQGFSRMERWYHSPWVLGNYIPWGITDRRGIVDIQWTRTKEAKQHARHKHSYPIQSCPTFPSPTSKSNSISLETLNWTYTCTYHVPSYSMATVLSMRFLLIDLYFGK